MNIVQRTGLKFWRDTHGSSMLGYAVLISLVLGAAYVGIGHMSGSGTWEPPQLISLPKWSPM